LITDSYGSYGEPINVDDYTRELFDARIDTNEAAKSVVKNLNSELERRLLALTINAPEWCVHFPSFRAIFISAYDE
jgi:glycerol-3-phosphate O-acyltransferase/dihydroxyacetone phosphate acyltransferase